MTSPIENDRPPDRHPDHSGGEIHLRIPHLRQLFDPLDPSPPAHKHLHPNVEEFIVSWGRNLGPKTPPVLVIHLDQPEPEGADATGAIHEFFHERALLTRSRLKELFRVGRISMVIALAILAITFTIGEILLADPGATSLKRALGGTLEIGGWVAMWRPMEIFLYDWWPIAGDIRLFARLAAMPVHLVCDGAS